MEHRADLKVIGMAGGFTKLCLFLCLGVVAVELNIVSSGTGKQVKYLTREKSGAQHSHFVDPTKIVLPHFHLKHAATRLRNRRHIFVGPHIRGFFINGNSGCCNRIPHMWKSFG